MKKNKIRLADAEATIRALVKRDGLSLKKRRSKKLTERYGIAYALVDTTTNTLVGHTAGDAQDGCCHSLESIAEDYRDDKKNTARQNQILAAVFEGRVQ